jgi:hypothetical protein
VKTKHPGLCVPFQDSGYRDGWTTSPILHAEDAPVIPDVSVVHSTQPWSMTQSIVTSGPGKKEEVKIWIRVKRTWNKDSNILEFLDATEPVNFKHTSHNFLTSKCLAHVYSKAKRFMLQLSLSHPLFYQSALHWTAIRSLCQHTINHALGQRNWHY